MTRKPMWNAEAVKAYESGQGVKLVNVPHPHYEPLPEDLNPESLETVEIEIPEPPQRTWVGLTSVDWNDFNAVKSNDPQYVAAWAEAKLKEKNL